MSDLNNNKRNRSSDTDSSNMATPAKKTCDPRSEATVPQSRTPGAGHEEAQARHTEAVRLAKHELAAQIQRREMAKAQAEAAAKASSPPAAGIPPMSLSPGTGTLVNEAVRLKNAQIRLTRIDFPQPGPTSQQGQHLSDLTALATQQPLLRPQQPLTQQQILEQQSVPQMRGQGSEGTREDGLDFLSYHYEASLEEAAANSLGQQHIPTRPRPPTSIDLSFVTILANDPRQALACLLYTSPSPRDRQKSRMPSSA